jgi:hypothetical protein
MVGHELHWPRLQSGHGGTNQRQNGDNGEPTAVWTEVGEKQTADAREATPPVRWSQRLT